MMRILVLCLFLFHTLIVFCQSSDTRNWNGISLVSQDIFQDLSQSQVSEYYYASDIIPTASCCGRKVHLLLRKDGYAELIHDYNNSAGGTELKCYGRWFVTLPESHIKVDCVRGENFGFPGQSQDVGVPVDTSVFIQKGDSLIENKAEGSYGPLVLKRKKTWPLYIERELYLWVDKQKAPSKHPFFKGQGLRVSYEKFPPQTYSEWRWEGVLDKIQGFHYKPGKIYYLHVKRKWLKDSLNGRGRYVYELLKVDSTLIQ